MFTKPDELIPVDSELAQLLAQWSEDSDSRTWNIANVTNELIDEWSIAGISKQSIYRAVAARCKGNKLNTIRRWAECAADFDEDMQQQYAQILSFNHFKTARRLLADGYIPDLEYALSWCVQGNDDKLQAGRPKTVNELIANFVPQEEGTSLGKYWAKIKEKLYDELIMLDHDIIRKQLVEQWKTIDLGIKTLEELSKKDEYAKSS